MIASDLEQLSTVTPAYLRAELRSLEGPPAKSTAIEYLLTADAAAGSLFLRSVIFLLHRTYGADEKRLLSKLSSLKSLGARFLALYGDGPVTLTHAPARINILGEHIDYVSYLPTASLPFGSREHDMLLLYRVSETNRVRGASASEEYPPFAFMLDMGPAHGMGNTEADWLSYLYENPAPAPHWGNYVKAAAYFARVKFGEQVRLGFDFVVDSSIPPGGGASSSSALVVLAHAAVYDGNHISCTPEQLARDAAKAEWYVGTRGGTMDHLTICLASRGHAVLIEYLEKRVRRVPLPGHRSRWVTFFSQPADKGRDVMIEYNERAAVSRILIPALIERWKVRQPERYRAWRRAIESFQTGSVAALDDLEFLLDELPETIVLAQMEQDYPEAFADCQRAFPALLEKRADRPLLLRARAKHHLREVRRVAEAILILDRRAQQQSSSETEEQIESAMSSLGRLLNESHRSLSDLYGVSTPEVERLVEVLCSDEKVYGAHLMGGGFGGNVLALTTDENASALIERVQAEYYGPRNRQGVHEGSVMISTPGDGLAKLTVSSIWREVVEQFNLLKEDAVQHRPRLGVMLDSMKLNVPIPEVWPVIVAAGKGTRARATGLEVPKPLAAVLGEPSINHVIRNIRVAFGSMRPPIVIVSPENEAAVRFALAGEEAIFVLQPEALGTGDAVLCAHEEMKDFQGRAFVIWSTQPAIRPETMRRTLKLTTLFDDYDMVLPTALKKLPYAPLNRDARGHVREARETHLESLEHPASGEGNIGLFVLKSQPMFAALLDLKQRYWQESERRYDRPGGELGFPNELINYLCEREKGVFACAIADGREEQGIKTLRDIPVCEKFISELKHEQEAMLILGTGSVSQ